MFVFLFSLIAFFSEIAGTVAGFGSSVFFVPLAGLFFDFHTVLALTSILHVFSNAAKLILFGRQVQWRLLLLLGLPSIFCVILGAWLSTKLQFKYSELILGLFLIAFSVFFFCKPLLKLTPNRLNAVTAGAALPDSWPVSSAPAEPFGAGPGCLRPGEERLRRDFGGDRFRRRFFPCDCLSAGQLLIVGFLLVRSWAVVGRLRRFLCGKDCLEQTAPEKLSQNRFGIGLSHWPDDPW